MSMIPNTSDTLQFGNSGVTYGDALEAGITLAADAMKVRPRNDVRLDDDQMRVVRDAALCAEAIGGDSAKDILRVLGATQLRNA